jgi:hypothetical protein
MKSFVLTLLASCSILFAQSQNQMPSRNDSSSTGLIALKLTPLTLTRNMWFTAHVDYAFHPQFSASLGISPNFLAKGNSYSRDSIWNYDNGDTTFYDYLKTKGYPGMSLDPEIRWYPNGVWNGWFLGLYSSQRFSSAKIEEERFISQIGGSGSIQYVPTRTGNYQVLKSRVSVMGLQAGYVKRWGKRQEWLIDIFGGLGVKSTIFKYENYGSLYPDETFVKPGIAGRLNASIGYILK